jgi:DNA excision repair protein ERCC-4
VHRPRAHRIFWISYLLTYDPLKFHSYLETIIASNSISATGGVRQHHSHWLFTDAANVIFKVAKRRCFIVNSVSKTQASPPVIDLVGGDEDEWEALNEIERQVAPSQKRKGLENESEVEKRPSWLPETIEPVLEELPKWTLLAEVLQEIEEEMMRHESSGNSRLVGQLSAYIIYLANGLLITRFVGKPGSNTVLIMTSSSFASKLIGEFLSTMDPDAPRGTQGRGMMLRKLHLYFWWKGRWTEQKQDGRSQGALSASGEGSREGLSEAVKKKDKEKAERTARRRRVRGGAPPAAGSEGERHVKVEEPDMVVGDVGGIFGESMVQS